MLPHRTDRAVVDPCIGTGERLRPFVDGGIPRRGDVAKAARITPE